MLATEIVNLEFVLRYGSYRADELPCFGRQDSGVEFQRRIIVCFHGKKAKLKRPFDRKPLRREKEKSHCNIAGYATIATALWNAKSPVSMWVESRATDEKRGRASKAQYSLVKTLEENWHKNCLLACLLACLSVANCCIPVNPFLLM